MVAAKTEGGLYIWRGARGLGEGASEAAAGSVAWPDSGGDVGKKESAGGLGWARPSRRGAVFFFKYVPRKILRRKINKNQKNTR